MKGTLLQQLQNDYQILENNIEEIKKKHDYHFDFILPEMKEKRDKLKHKYRDCQQHSQLEEEIRKYKNMLIWAQIVECEEASGFFTQEIQQLEGRKEKILEKVASHDVRAAEASVRLQDAEAQCEQAGRMADDMEAIRKPLEDKYNEIIEENRALNGKRRDLEREKEEMNRAIGEARRNLHNYQEQIEDIYRQREDRLSE